MAGELVNRTGSTVEFATLSVDQLASDGRLLATTEAYTDLSRMDSGEKSGFKTYFEPVAGYHHFGISSISASPSYGPANRNFTVTVTNTYNDAEGDHHIVGTVRNDNATAAAFVSVAGTFYDASGRVVDAAWALPNTGSDFEMAPGQTASFDLSRFVPAAHDSFVLVADSFDDPTPLPTTTSIAGGGTLTHGQKTTISARVLKRGTQAGADGVTVTLQGQRPGSSTWFTVATAATDYDGAVSFSPRPTRSTTYRLVVAGSPTQVGSASSTVTVKVNAAVEVEPSDSRVAKGDRVKLAVEVSPSMDGERVTLQRRDDGEWVKVDHEKLDRKSEASFKVKAKKTGTIRYRVTVAGSAGNGPGTSEVVKVKVGRA